MIFMVSVRSVFSGVKEAIIVLFPMLIDIYNTINDITDTQRAS